MADNQIAVEGPGVRRSVLAGLLAGALVGLLATGLCVPLRRAVSVTDRSIINGLSLTVGSVIIWTVAGLVYAMQARRTADAQRWLLSGTVAAAIAVWVFILADVGPLAPYSAHFARLAVPLTVLVTLGGAVLFLCLLRVRLSLPLAAPAGLLAALAVGVLVYAADREGHVHYTLSRVPVSASVQGTPAGTAPVVVASPSATPVASPAPVVPLHLVVSHQSEAAYTVREKLARLPGPSDAIGKTSALTGDLYLLPTGMAPDKPSSFTVDLSALTSDAPPRDRYVRTFTLETAKYPTATYTITGVDGFPASYKEGDEVKLTLSGTFKVHDTEGPLTWTGTARYTNGTLEAVASTDFDMHDFNINPPNNSVAVSESKVHLDLHLIAVQAPS